MRRETSYAIATMCLGFAVFAGMACDGTSDGGTAAPVDSNRACADQICNPAGGPLCGEVGGCVCPSCAEGFTCVDNTCKSGTNVEPPPPGSESPAREVQSPGKVKSTSCTGTCDAKGNCVAGGHIDESNQQDAFLESFDSKLNPLTNLPARTVSNFPLTEVVTVPDKGLDDAANVMFGLTDFGDVVALGPAVGGNAVGSVKIDTGTTFLSGGGVPRMAVDQGGPFVVQPIWTIAGAAGWAEVALDATLKVVTSKVFTLPNMTPLAQGARGAGVVPFAKGNKRLVVVNRKANGHTAVLVRSSDLATVTFDRSVTSDRDPIGLSAILLTDGSAVIAGQIKSGAGDTDGLLLKLDAATGAVTQQIAIGTSADNESIDAVVEAPDGTLRAALRSDAGIALLNLTTQFAATAVHRFNVAAAGGTYQNVAGLFATTDSLRLIVGGRPGQAMTPSILKLALDGSVSGCSIGTVGESVPVSTFTTVATTCTDSAVTPQDEKFVGTKVTQAVTIPSVADASKTTANPNVCP